MGVGAGAVVGAGFADTERMRVRRGRRVVRVWWCIVCGDGGFGWFKW